MNWSDDVVEKVADAINWNDDRKSGYKPLAQAALSAITLQDIAGLPEVKALVEAAFNVCVRWETPTTDDLRALRKALAPFTEASND